jgi:hypothetical protein
VIFKLSLPSVGEKTLGKELFAECCICGTRQRALCRVSKIKHSAKSFFAECFILPRVFCVTLGKEFLCRVPEKKHSAKNMALGKEPNSGSVRSNGDCVSNATQLCMSRSAMFTLLVNLI